MSDENAASLNNVREAAIQLARGALADPEVMKLWAETFPGLCPGCFRPLPNNMTKGLCVPCHLKRTKALKQLTTQE